MYENINEGITMDNALRNNRRMHKTYQVEDTNFIFATNFSGDPNRDRFSDPRRKFNLKVPKEMADEMVEDGFSVRETRMRENDDPETWQPEYYVTPILKYRDVQGHEMKYPPKVYLVVGDNDPELLTEDTVNLLDDIRVSNVTAILNTHVYDETSGKKNLYVRSLYVEKAPEEDPYLERYKSRAKRLRAMREQEE